MDQNQLIYEKYYKSLCLIHKIILRSVDSIIKHSDEEKVKMDAKNFMGYILCFHDTIHEHHHNEEEFVFPLMKIKHDVSPLENDHRILIEHMNELKSFVMECANKKKKYNSHELKEIILKIKELIVPHFNEEETQSTPEALEKNFSAKEINDVIEKILKENQKNSSPWKDLVFISSHLNEDEKNFFFAEMPFLIKFLLKHLFCRRFSGYWKYSSCS
jgi:hypothetical protein